MQSNICFCSGQVTHLVSELDNIEAVYSRLKLTGSLLQHVRANSHVLNTGWLTACLKAGKLVKIEDHHKIPHSKKEVGYVSPCMKYNLFNLYVLKKKKFKWYTVPFI